VPVSDGTAFHPSKYVNNMFLKNIALMTLATLSVMAPAMAQTSAQQHARSMTLRRMAPRGYLGVGVVELTDDRVKALKLNDDQGVEVKRVDPTSPADKAGLKQNDVILEINGKAIEDIEQFQNSIGETQPGTKVNLTIWRNGAKQTIAAMLDSRPENIFSFVGPDTPDAPMPPMPAIPPNADNPFSYLPGNSAVVGFEGEGLNPQLAEFFGVRDGVLVRSVNPMTPAAKAGLKAGDVVVKVNGTPVMSPREITGMVRASRKKALTFTVVRNKKEMTLNVELARVRFPFDEHEVL
jgi:serine protease Do